MGGELFEEGGPHQIKRTGPDRHEFKISIPLGEDKMVGRDCPEDVCSPGYFRIKLGTGLTEQSDSYCPYCRHKDAPTKFTSQAQGEYAKAIAIGEAKKGIQRMLSQGLGLGPSGKKTISGGLISLNMELKMSPPSAAPRLIEEELRRDIVCPNCTLSHSVYGLAAWCPDCGKDIFLTHVEAEMQVVQMMLGDLDRRRQQFGARVAARDIENALEDAVSIFEAILKVIARRQLLARGLQLAEVDEILAKKIANRFQNIATASEVYQREFGVNLLDCLSEQQRESLAATFEKRHPITHNLGIVDAKYLRKARAGELQGRDVRVTSLDVQTALGLASVVLTATYRKLFQEKSA